MVGLGQVGEPVSRGETSGWLCILHEEVQSQGKTRRRRAHSARERERARRHSWTPPRFYKWEFSTVDSGWSALRQPLHDGVVQKVWMASQEEEEDLHVMKWIVESYEVSTRWPATQQRTVDAPTLWVQEQVIDAATVNLQQRVVERGVVCVEFQVAFFFISRLWSIV